MYATEPGRNAGKSAREVFAQLLPGTVDPRGIPHWAISSGKEAVPNLMIVPGNPWSAGRDSWRALAVLVADALVGFRSPALAGAPVSMLTESIKSTVHSPSQTFPSVGDSTSLSTSNDSFTRKIPG